MRDSHGLITMGRAAQIYPMRMKSQLGWMLKSDVP